jgi:hypothetical protein
VFKHRLKHRSRQFSGERVLLAGVIGADQSHAIRQNNECAMAKPWPRSGHPSAVFLMRREKRVECNLSQCNDHSDIFQQFELLNEVRPAAGKFDRSGLVAWRRASNSSGDIAIRELETVLSMNRLRLIGESSEVKGSVQPIAATVTREHSSGPIPPVRRWC